jgi:hypothetical protein
MSSPSIRYIETSSVLAAPLAIYWAVLLAMPRPMAPVSGARP